MDVLNNTRQLYRDEQFWFVGVAILLGLSFFFNSIPLVVCAGVLYGTLPLIVEQIFKLSQIERPVKAVSETNDVGILLGNTEGNAPIYIDLETMNHMFIIGMTRYGKTRLVLSLITELITKFSKDEVKLAFSDAKAVSFNVFARSQHLFAPIAKSEEATENLIELILEEMHRRLAIFSEYHEEICTNIDEYYELTGERLPRIIVIFDEVADSVAMNSLAEKNLTTLAKMGLAAGIHLVLITQRPTKVGISHEITSQCQTILCTYMRNQVEYGSVAKIPQTVYSKMRPEKGLFIAFNPDLAPSFLKMNPTYEGWGMLKAHYTENDYVKQVAVDDSTEHLDLPALESSIPGWRGSEEDKLEAMRVLEMKLGKITRADMKKYFGVSGRTANTWMEKFYGDSQDS